MSHFTVLVIGSDHDAQLAPFHEFESTGRDDQYVQDIDITDDYRNDYATNTKSMVRQPDGTLISLFTDAGEYREQFLREPTPEEVTKYGTQKGFLGSGSALDSEGGHIRWISRDFRDGRGYRGKVVTIPEGCEEVQVSVNKLMTFTEYVTRDRRRAAFRVDEPVVITDESKYGYTLVDAAGEVVKVVRRTNPNRKWDWYQVGGRWTGFFKKKVAALSGSHGEPSLLAMMDKDYERPGSDRADVIRKGDVDWDGMRDEVEAKAAIRYDKVHAIIAGRSVEPWPSVVDRFGEDHKGAREFYREQEVVRDLSASADDDLRWVTFDGLEDYLVPREQYLRRMRAKAVITFAVLKDGVWYERGEMGWWGVVHDEKDENEWAEQYSKLIDSLPENMLLTLMDCHI